MLFKPAPDALPQQKGIERYFLVQFFSFICVGIDPTSLKRTYVSYFLILMPMMSQLLLCISILIYASQYIQDLDLLIEIITPFCQTLLSVLKYMYFLWNKERIIKLVRKLWLWNLKANDEELKILAEENRKDMKLSMSYYGFVFTTGIMALISPFVIAFSYHLKGEGFRNHLGLPLKAAYFGGLENSFSYSMGYFVNFWGVYFVINSSLGIDSLFCWFMHNVSAQFRILNLLIKRDASMVRCEGDEEEFLYLLIQRIKYHVHVIDLAQNFNDVYMNILFIKFTISCLQIAFLAYQFAKGIELSTQLYYLLFLISVSLQLILYCYGGQKIKDESTSVADVIYQYFKWHDLSIKSKKLLLLSIMRAQKPFTVTGVFFVADLHLYLWIFRTAGSFVTLLMTLEEKKVK